MVGGSKPLVISSSLLPGDLFTESLLVVQCSVRSPTNRKRQIHLTFFFDTGATGIAFVDIAMVHHVCEVLQILFIPLAKLKPVRGFNGRPAPDITYLTVQGHSELLAPILVIKLS